MNWFTSLFSPGSSQRKGQAIISTHEAFSIPSASPILSSHPDSFNPDTPSISNYTYPPASPVSYGYLPTSSGSRSNTLLPMHHDQLHTPLSPSSSYPPLQTTWNRLRLWLSREYPELGDTLNYGILPQDLSQIELQFGFPLPAVVRESYLIVDGQEAESAAGCADGLFFGLNLLPLEEVLEQWRFWREVDEDPSTGANPQLRQHMQSLPPGWIRKEYSQRGWIPLIADKTGNYIGVDLNPAEDGVAGQVIVFGRDFDTKVVLYNGDGRTGWAKWLASFVDDLESGEGFEIGGGNDSGEDSEDELGYESYFYDGTGRGQGDGGGDATPGLRLAGEYKGWSVMEAWADRSVRKWYESGVISEKVDNEKVKAKVDIDALEINPAAAEVAIPVLADTDDVERKPSSSHLETKRSPSELPTISITKPPLPIPIELPTPREIGGLPSPPDSRHSSFDEDLEAGRRSAREHTPHTVQRSQAASSPSGQSSTSPEQARANANVAGQEDLLADAEPLTDPTPVIQASPLLSSHTDAQVMAEPELIEVGSLSVDEDKSQHDLDPDLTIRLVGGGGSSGILPEAETDTDAGPRMEETDTNEKAADADAESIVSAGSETGAGKEAKKHKKTKSGLAGLKKLGQLGRKKDSISA
ncbi:hypothetical protein E1B28_002525 [Marasmius oreades]|uniref:Knr4/Smi1-like domain-containing protein n=1 Tax=Marasmius oreades TaxID=181124 RepID=A0A9P7RMT7_9AGAR|nr:uncharacterized protein E1B28_002525 [Marasmius oreades]KAG7086579.1 hypothetical protein E1B28_002525 [Marasmius oreades]